MQSLAERFYEIGEPYAGGLFEQPGRGSFYRYARAQRMFWERQQMPEYLGGKLYPAGRKYPNPPAVVPDFSYTVSVEIDWARLDAKDAACCRAMREEWERLPMPKPPHVVGGAGYVHSIPNYGRVLQEGLDRYAERVSALPEGDFRDGLLEILAGIRAYHARSLALLEAQNADAQLIEALRRVPFQPARSLYEAVVCWNFIYYIDGCDNPGRLDADLIGYYRGEDITPLLREYFEIVDRNDGWSSAVGPDCNPLTLQVLRAVRGLRRPSVELRVTPDTPDEVWQAAADALETSCGSPALYCEQRYQQELARRFPDIPEADRLRFNGGGCTETMLAGLSNVGSLDAGINMPLVFSGWMRESLADCADFDAFYNGLMARTAAVVAQTLDQINDFRRTRAEVRPQPVRTLLIDDCIDRGLDFNAGGARYNWSIINFAGLVNVIDSLLAVRELVYGKKLYSPQAFIAAVDAHDPAYLARLRDMPVYGVDDDAADALAADFVRRAFASLDQRTPYLGGAFLPASIQFTTYVDAGRAVPATPDGRAAGEPLADSHGAVQGRDTAGPTALLRSVAKLPLQSALGTPVLNLRLQKQFLRAALRPLVLGFFEEGGMQVQISCLSREEILDAMAHPEKHENLIVRTGGYSEYFNRLTPELKQTVLKRTEFGA